jgi:hypothetical protein
MDSKITKKRLSMFLQYEWLKIVAIILCVCLLWTAVFIMLGSHNRLLTDGQCFYFYYSPDIYAGCSDNMKTLIDREDALSYEVQETSITRFDARYGSDQLSGWLAIGDGDMIICTDAKGEDGNYTNSYFRTILNAYKMYDFDALYADAVSYATAFKVDEELPFTEENLSLSAVETEFNRRLGKDKRFKKDFEKKQGILLEKERITKLFQDITDFAKLLNKDIFVTATSEYYAGEPAKKYGIDLSKLPSTANKTDVSYYVQTTGADGKATTEGTVLAVFNFLNRQPELQFEVLSVINTLVRETTNFLD